MVNKVLLISLVAQFASITDIQLYHQYSRQRKACVLLQPVEMSIIIIIIIIIIFVTLYHRMRVFMRVCT